MKRKKTAREIAYIEKRTKFSEKELRRYSKGQYQVTPDNYFYSDGEEELGFVFDGVEFTLSLKQEQIPVYEDDVLVAETVLYVNGMIKETSCGDGEDWRSCQKAISKGEAFIRNNICRGTNPIGLDRKQALKLAGIITDTLDFEYSDVTDYLDDLSAERQSDEIDRAYLDRDYYNSVFSR